MVLRPSGERVRNFGMPTFWSFVQQCSEQKFNGVVLPRPSCREKLAGLPQIQSSCQLLFCRWDDLAGTSMTMGLRFAETVTIAGRKVIWLELDILGGFF
jgi:hypothetical protein